jgi:uncharacterized protein
MRRSRWQRAGAALVGGLLLAACTGSPGATPAPGAAPGATSPPGASPGDRVTAGSPTDDAIVTFATPPPLHPTVDAFDAGVVEVVATNGQRHHVAVRIARTPDERTHGLMHVPDLPDGAGMWFVFESDRTGAFWMKNTLVALDIAYVDANGRVVSIADAVPCESDPCPTYPPEGPYRTVLEVPAGWFNRIGAGVGSQVRPVAP